MDGKDDDEDVFIGETVSFEQGAPPKRPFIQFRRTGIARTIFSHLRPQVTFQVYYNQNHCKIQLNTVKYSQEKKKT